MRFYFFILLSIFLISVLAVITVNSITGDIPVVGECPDRCTYFPLKTMGDYDRLKERLEDRFYIYGIYESPGFDSEKEYVACACLTN